MENVIWKWQWTCLKTDYEMHPGGRCSCKQEDTNGTDFEKNKEVWERREVLTGFICFSIGPHRYAVETLHESSDCNTSSE